MIHFLVAISSIDIRENRVMSTVYCWSDERREMTSSGGQWGVEETCLELQLFLHLFLLTGHRRRDTNCLQDHNRSESYIMTWIYLIWKFSAHGTYWDATVILIMRATWFDL